MYASLPSNPSTSLHSVESFESSRPYCNPELERALVGALLSYPRYFLATFSALTASYRPPSFKLDPWECFYDAQCGWLYQGMFSLNEVGQTIDIPLLERWLLDNNPKRYEKNGGLDWLKTLANLGSTAVGIEDASHQILKAALRRWQEQELAELKMIARNPAIDCCEANAEIGARMLKMIYSHKGGGSKRLSDVRRSIEQDYEEYQNTGMPSAIPTGFAAIDQHMGGGYRRGELTIFAGRSSMGKTSWVISSQIQAASSGFSVLFFSLEQSEKSVFNQLASSRSQIETKLFELPENLARLKNNPGQYQRLMQAFDEVERLDITIDDQSSPSIADIKNTATKWVAESENPSLIFLDYIGLIPSNAKGDMGRRSAELSGYAKELRALAKDLNVAVVVWAQISNDVEGRQDKRPTLGDLSESKSMITHADVVGMFYRDSYYNRDLAAEIEQTGRLDTIEIGFEKGRSIGMKRFYLNWHGPTRTFIDRAQNTEFDEDF